MSDAGGAEGGRAEAGRAEAGRLDAGRSGAEHVLFVHAHPDDETIESGGTIATLLDRGASVTVLTCTRGERGEVLPADLKSALGSAESMAALRTSELTEAMAILGVTDHRYLGDANARWSGRDTRTYSDSGMAWGPDGARPTGEFDPESLEASDFGDVAADVAAVLLDVSPTAVVSHDERGGYGHPDHIRAHDAAKRAAEVYGIPFYAVSDSGEIAVDVAGVQDRKRAALNAYRSQLTIDGDVIEFPDGRRRPIGTLERFSVDSVSLDAPVPFAEQHPAARFFAAVLGGVIGAALGALLTVYNGYTVKIGGQEIWIGAIVGALVLLALLLGFRLAFGTRIVAAFAALGVLVVVGIFSFPSGSGSLLITQSGAGLLWEIAPPVIAFVVLVWPQRSPRRAR
jgi:N-acetyl-1-D-myo-inositol-2-amino-2-deoxy-alpha-D-glucopyranoside deacetylase